MVAWVSEKKLIIFYNESIEDRFFFVTDYNQVFCVLWVCYVKETFIV